MCNRACVLLLLGQVGVVHGQEHLDTSLGGVVDAVRMSRGPVIERESRLGRGVQQVFVVEGCVNVLLPHPHRVRIMPIENDTRIGARLAQVRVARGVTSVTTITTRYHERTRIGVHVGPKSGEHEPEGRGGRKI